MSGLTPDERERIRASIAAQFDAERDESGKLPEPAPERVRALAGVVDAITRARIRKAASKAHSAAQGHDCEAYPPGARDAS